MRSRSRDRVIRVREEDIDRQFSRDGRKGDRSPPRRRSKERDHDFFGNKFEEHKEKKKQPQRFSNENNSNNRAFDGNFIDLTRNIGFGDTGGGDIILDPSSINFNSFKHEERTERQPEAPHPPRIEPYVRQSEHMETANERIKRLEKLVEKLVETNNKSPKRENKSSRSSKDFPELIPSNTKFTTSMWLNRVHEECLKRGYNEKTIIQFTRDKMTGIMKAWFKTVCNYDFTWPELKLLITKTFPDNVEFASTLRLLVGRDKTSEETITQYYFSKVYLCEACKISGENAVSCLIDGLSNPFMKQNIKSFNFISPEALYSEYLAKFPENEIPVHIEQREVVQSYAGDEFLHIEPPSLDYHPPKSRIERKEKLVRCHTCKKIGHITVECRHAPICYTCKKKGHISAKCHFKKINN